MNKTRLSIIVPVYNVEKYIDECICSVLDQTYENWELILVDDGSTDNSGNMCDKYASQNPKIKAFHKSNGGQLHTRLFAMNQAKGDYYIFLDSDDTLKSGALETVYSTVNRYNCDCVIYGLDNVCNGSIVSTVREEETICLSNKRELYKKIFFNTSYNSMCRKAIKSSLVEDVDYSSYFHLRYGEDLLQSLQILKNAQDVVFISDTLYNYRANPNSVTHNVNFANYKVDFSIREAVHEFIISENVFDENDYREYMVLCAEMLVSQIKMIALFDTSTKHKRELYNEIRKTEFYENISAFSEYKHREIGREWFILKLFQNKKYRLMISLINIYTSLRGRK